MTVLIFASCSRPLAEEHSSWWGISTIRILGIVMLGAIVYVASDSLLPARNLRPGG
jgi:hypothetical protein